MDMIDSSTTQAIAKKPGGYFWGNVLYGLGLEDLPFIARVDLAALGGDDPAWPAKWLTEQAEWASRKYGRCSAEIRIELLINVLQTWGVVERSFRLAASAIQSTTGEVRSEAEMDESRRDLLKFFWARCASISPDDIEAITKTLLFAATYELAFAATYGRAATARA